MISIIGPHIDKMDAPSFEIKEVGKIRYVEGITWKPVNAWLFYFYFQIYKYDISFDIYVDLTKLKR